MKYYFYLQYKMLSRQLSEFGINPALAYILSVLLFAGLSQYIFNKGSYVPYIYGLIPVLLAVQLSERKRNEFLRSCFSYAFYIRIRLLENIILGLPFLIFLLYRQQWTIVPVVLIVCCILSFIRLSNQYSYTLPTPFYKYPFEFVVGFRSSIVVILFAYLLGVIAIIIGNFNLSLFALAVLLGVCASFYLNTEKEFYVWIYSLTAKEFIWNKARTLVCYTSLLCLPLTIALCSFFPAHALLIIGLQFLGYLYGLAALFSKYANFPDPLILPEVIILGASVIFPPLLLVLIPYFYIKSQKRLKEVLA